MWGGHACAFCGSAAPAGGGGALGALVGPTSGGEYFHRECALWSSEVWQPDGDRLWLLKGVSQALRRGKQIRFGGGGGGGDTGGDGCAQRRGGRRGGGPGDSGPPRRRRRRGMPHTKQLHAGR
jgi:hypothetical protein